MIKAIVQFPRQFYNGPAIVQLSREFCNCLTLTKKSKLPREWHNSAILEILQFFIFKICLSFLGKKCRIP
jgi:hypothetical protein